MLTAKDVAEITRILEESAFDELDLEIDGMKLSLRRGTTAAPRETVATGSAAPKGSAVAAAGQSAQGPSARGQPAPGQSATEGQFASPGQSTSPGQSAVQVQQPIASDPSLQEVPAPMLGTFYRAPKPGAAPYIEVGSPVEADTIIGIIEVMKLMNVVRAGVRGRVAEIAARDGVLVEYGETLIRVSKVD